MLHQLLRKVSVNGPQPVDAIQHELGGEHGDISADHQQLERICGQMNAAARCQAAAGHVPIVIRAFGGAGIGFEAQHSQR